MQGVFDVDAKRRFSSGALELSSPLPPSGETVLFPSAPSVARRPQTSSLGTNPLRRQAFRS